MEDSELAEPRGVRRHLKTGFVDASDVIVTIVATEAFNRYLPIVAQPCDVIAVESATYHTMLHAIDRLGTGAIDMPTHPGASFFDGAEMAFAAS
jgi:DNA-binding transcriptional MocR family regulator